MYERTSYRSQGAIIHQPASGRLETIAFVLPWVQARSVSSFYHLSVCSGRLLSNKTDDPGLWGGSVETPSRGGIVSRPFLNQTTTITGIVQYSIVTYTPDNTDRPPCASSG